MTASIEGVQAYPLAWPTGWPRQLPESRGRSRYNVTFTRARDELVRSLKLLGTPDFDVVISTNVALRRDGLPYANLPQPADPGVAVYWVQKKQPRVMACDCWRTVRDNLRAVGLALEGLRSIERSGASQILDRAFAGFAALPAQTTRTWQQVLRLENMRAPDFVMRAAIEASYKSLAQKHHPDVGGSHEKMLELNEARDAALRELT